MNRKFLIIALMMSVCLMGNAKTQVYETMSAAIEAAKEQAKTKAEKILSDVALSLKSGKNNVNGKNVKKSNQFTCEPSKVIALYKGGKLDKDASQLDKTIEKLKDKKIMPSEFTNAAVSVGKEELVKDEDKNVEYQIPVTFEAHTITPAIDNNAKYDVTFYYTVKLNKIKDKPIVNGKTDKKADKIVTGYTINTLEFEKSNVKDKTILGAEAKHMREEAQKAINAWYEAIPSSLSDKYSEFIVNNKRIDEVNGNGIKLNHQGKTITATGNPVVIKYEPEISEESSHLYTDPTATLTLTPSFKIVFGDDLKTIVSEDIVVNYKEEKSEAVTDEQKYANYYAARGVIDNFGNALSQYVTDKNKNTRANIMTMFTDSKNDEVAVSHRSKYNNKENITKRKAEKYLQLLSGNNLTFDVAGFVTADMVEALNVENPDLNLTYDPNLNTVMFEIDQVYDGKNYKDRTRKIAVLKKQADNSFLIERIVVVPNSTVIE